MADSTIVFITGANTGIGLEIVKALLRSERKYHVFLGGRNISKAEKAAKEVAEEIKSASTVEPIQIDVESDESIKAAFEKVSSKHDRIDVLINNAGATFDMDIPTGALTERQAYNKTWDVNVTGAQVTTSTFMPLLLKSSDARLIFNTSGASSLKDASDPSSLFYKVPPAGFPKPPPLSVAYRSSKAGLNMLMCEWTRLLKNDNVKVWAVAPGLLATNLARDPDRMRQMGAREPHFGGTAICNVVEGKRDAEVGLVVREYMSPVQPW